MLVLELFEKLYTHRQLVRLIGLRFSGLVQGHYQLNLFEDTGQEVRLLEQMDRIGKRFGEGAVMKWTTMR